MSTFLRETLKSFIKLQTARSQKESSDIRNGDAIAYFHRGKVKAFKQVLELIEKDEEAFPTVVIKDFPMRTCTKQHPHEEE